MINNIGITSFINFPIIIDAHEHPLLFCYCQRKSEANQLGWKCDKCLKDYSYDSPSFYCTYCDFDLCQECMSKYQLSQINPYSKIANIFNIPNNTSNKLYNWQKYFSEHIHLLSPIKKIHSSSWICDKCHKKYNINNKVSYYCSLCDYDICYKCDKKNGQYRFINDEKDEEREIIDCSQCSDNDHDSADDPFYIPRKRYRYYPPRNDRELKKPVIYLYPEKEMDISVQLIIESKNDELETIYPKFNGENNIWKVVAKPNGDIHLGNKVYPYLFWEAKSYNIGEIKEGFIVKAENAEEFLEEKLKLLGLNDKESTDFITYWLPVLLKNKLSLCNFQSQTVLKNFQLNITPKPDTLIRIFLSIQKIDSPIDIKTQNLELNIRKGFTVIEWGGTNF